MIPQPLAERAAALMSDDAPVAEMLNAIVDRYRNPMLYINRGLALDPRVFNAHNFERIEGRARLTGDVELAHFMRDLAQERREFDREEEQRAEAAREGRVLRFEAAAELFRALGFKSDDQVKALRIEGYRLSPMMKTAAFALVKDSPLSLVQ